MLYRDATLDSVYSPDTEAVPFSLPVYSSRVQAGFPSPAEDYIEGKLDLNEHLIQHKAATFFVRASGDSMINAGIFPNDLLIVDRALEAKSGSIVIAVLNGELTVKRLEIKDGTPLLCPENPSYPCIPFTSFDDFSIWGVVTHVIHATT